MKRHIAIAALMMVVAACGDSGNGTAGDTSSGAVGASGAASVDIDEFAFGPDSLEVAVGTEVTWRNSQSGVPHTVTADEGSWQGTDSGTLQEGATFGFTFFSAGTYTYHCRIHASMTGSVTVTG